MNWLISDERRQRRTGNELGAELGHDAIDVGHRQRSMRRKECRDDELR